MGRIKGRRAERREQELQLTDQQRRAELEREFKPIFNEYSEDGGIPLRVLRQKLSQHEDALPPGKLELLLRKADEDMDGTLDWDEFARLMMQTSDRTLTDDQLTTWQKVVKGAVTSVVPNQKDDYGEPLVNDYISHYNCRPPPLFMIFISITELVIFIYYAVELKGTKQEVTALTGIPLHSPFIFTPSRRYEAWRFLTYMFIHQGYMHLVFNLLFQLLLGIPLEMVHKWWRMGIVYSLGVLAGSLCHSVFDTNTMLGGASGGCYALIGAHFAITIMNWKEMTHDWLSGPVRFVMSAPFRLFVWTLVAGIDTGMSIYTRYNSDGGPNVGYAAHFGGALAGLLIGIPVLKNIHVKPWEEILWWISLILYLLCVIFAVCWNAFYPNFPETDWRPCCPYPKYYKP